MSIQARGWCYLAVVVGAVLLTHPAKAVATEVPFDRDAAEPCLACRNYRAGTAQSVACYAQPSNTPRYIGYYVGGGTAVGGECRYANEGTWGWDYYGGLVLRRVTLNWSHGRRYQGGIGSYRTDGPRLVQPH